MKVIVQETEKGNQWNITCSEVEIAEMVTEYATWIGKATGVPMVLVMMALRQLSPSEVKEHYPHIPEVIYQILVATKNSKRNMADALTLIKKLADELANSRDKK